MSENKPIEQQIKALVDCLNNTCDEEADCAEFDLETDCLAEWITSGALLESIIKPNIAAHLKQSKDCQEEFEALIAVLKAEKAGELDK